MSHNVLPRHALLCLLIFRSRSSPKLTNATGRLIRPPGRGHQHLISVCATIKRENVNICALKTQHTSRMKLILSKIGKIEFLGHGHAHTHTSLDATLTLLNVHAN
uniref:Putative secreted protein n=1 Tax=Anopheles darlingi TaxID=43151 RepID=A0A2M4D9I9_ANODA